MVGSWRDDPGRSSLDIGVIGVWKQGYLLGGSLGGEGAHRESAEPEPVRWLLECFGALTQLEMLLNL